jgi:hypothetical protein
MILGGRKVHNHLKFHVFAAFIAACGDPTPHAGHTDTDTGLVTCQTDPLVQAYAQGLIVASTDGQVRLQLVASEPGPPIAGVNKLTVRMLGSDSKPLSGATLAAGLPSMPHHGHSGSVLPKATANPDGTWTVAPLQLSMAGVWRVPFTVQSGGVEREISLHFCIEG